MRYLIIKIRKNIAHILKKSIIKELKSNNLINFTVITKIKRIVMQNLLYLSNRFKNKKNNLIQIICIKVNKIINTFNKMKTL